MTRRLPPDPSFRYVQKEAKDLLKAQRRGEGSACPVLRNHPRFVKATDAEILASVVSLQEMQHALALDYGFKSWAELRAAIEAMRRDASTAGAMPSSASKCQLCNRSATTHVTDIRDGKRLAAHYCGMHTPADIRHATAPKPDLTISVSPGQIESRSDGSVFTEVIVSADNAARVGCIRLQLPWGPVLLGGHGGWLKDGREWRLDRSGPGGKPLLVRFKVESP